MPEETVDSARHEVDLLARKDFTSFKDEVYPESLLRLMFQMAHSMDKREVVRENLMDALVDGRTRAFDWNCGSYLQHEDPEKVIDLIPASGDERNGLYGSIGFTWCLGEYGRKHSAAVRFLEDVVVHSRNDESWWRAAHALEKLGMVDAISYLKSAVRADGLRPLEECLEDLGNERNRISILLHSKVETLQEHVLPEAKHVLHDTSRTPKEHMGAAWLIGRFQYLDSEIRNDLRRLLNGGDYEVKFYILETITAMRSQYFLPDLEQFLDDADPLLRKHAARGLGNIDSEQALILLKEGIETEREPFVVSAMARSIYKVVHHSHRFENQVRRSIGANENGMISDEGDKWYVNPDIYHLFAEREDPENLTFRLALSSVQELELHDPVDLGAGTGRFAWYLLEHLRWYKGRLHCLDKSEQMCGYLRQRIRREAIPHDRIEVIEGEIADVADLVGHESSDLIVASFAFPSSIGDRRKSIQELRAVANCLRPNGHLITVGWDETFNDELNEMWYRYVPDDIAARNFEEWRQERVGQIEEARNCGLTWYKKGVEVPLEFLSHEESARVMGYLFGRSAADRILDTRQIRWNMSLGITMDPKERIERILEDREEELEERTMQVAAEDSV